jgi:hypothetical protein
MATPERKLPPPLGSESGHSTGVDGCGENGLFRLLKKYTGIKITG